MKLVIPAIFLAAGVRAFGASGNEARCAELGANCVASEPLNTNIYTSASGESFWNPADTAPSDKQASNDGIIGAAVAEQSGFSETPVDSGDAITALPPGHTIAWVLRQPIGGGGQSIATKFPTTSPTALRSFRFYRYYSPDHVWTDETHPLCNSGKLLQLGFRGTFTGGPLVSLDGDVSFYDVKTSLGWSQNQQDNCCMTAPGSQGVSIPSQAKLRGRWWRVEFALHNAAPGGPSAYWEMWLKNVTDNEPEIKVMDSRVAMMIGPNASFWWQTPMTDNLHPSPSPISDFAINMFRSNNGSPCDGYIAHTSVLWAAWDTDAGQRIGPACEVEGGCSSGNDTRAPERPRGLRLR
ncbi:MAG: hypothetical protein AAB036_05110 [Elusimicrobiota bacterium]